MAGGNWDHNHEMAVPQFSYRVDAYLKQDQDDARRLLLFNQGEFPGFELCHVVMAVLRRRF